MDYEFRSGTKSSNWCEWADAPWYQEWERLAKKEYHGRRTPEFYYEREPIAKPTNTPVGRCSCRACRS